MRVDLPKAPPVREARRTPAQRTVTFAWLGFWIGAWAGAMLGAILVLAYDSTYSANASVNGSAHIINGRGLVEASIAGAVVLGAIGAGIASATRR